MNDTADTYKYRREAKKRGQLQAAMLNITLWFVMMILYHIASQLSRIAKSLEKKNNNSSQ